MSDQQLAFMFPWISGVIFFGVLYFAGLIGPDDDDDGPDDGVMIPAYNPTS